MKLLTSTLLISLLFSVQAHAFTLISQNLKGWKKETLKFFVNSSNCSVSSDTLNQAVEDAISLWNSVPTMGMKLELAGNSTVSAATAFAGNGTDDGVTIACSTTFGTLTGASASSVIGVGSPSTNSAREIVYASLILNSEASQGGNIQNFAGDTLAAVLAHEIGHTIGLGHTGASAGLMYPSLGRQILRLAQDDIDGVTYLYPRSEPGDGFYGCGTVQPLSSSGGGPTHLNALLSLTGMFLFFGLAWKSTRYRRALQHKEA